MTLNSYLDPTYHYTLSREDLDVTTQLLLPSNCQFEYIDLMRLCLDDSSYRWVLCPWSFAEGKQKVCEEISISSSQVLACLYHAVQNGGEVLDEYGIVFGD